MFFVAKVPTNSKNRPPLQEENVKRKMKTRGKQWRKKRRAKTRRAKTRGVSKKLVR